MPILQLILITLAALAALGVVTVMILLKSTVRTRDRVRRPDERVYGAGNRRALLLYQPSNRGSNVNTTLALAKVLGAEGYTAIVNHPSEVLPYRPEDFDLLLFGTNVYLGQTAKPLQSYLRAQRFTGKRVILYVTGSLAGAPELAELAGCVPPGNDVRTVKLKSGEQDKLIDFVKANLT